MYDKPSRELYRIAALLVPVVFAVHIAARLYFLFSLPISVDAAMTFSDYTVHGIGRAATFYPAPNNHVLHSILTTFFYMPGDYQTYLIRIPAFLFGIAGLWLFYKITRKTFGVVAALVALAVFGAIQPVFLYGYLARGYSMLLFFALAAIFFWTREGSVPNRKNGLLYTVCVALGVYTIPSNLYFAFAFAVGVGFLHLGTAAFWVSVIRLAVYNTLALLLALLLYLPIISRQGIGAIISNKYVAAKDSLGINEWLEHFMKIGDYYLLWEGSLGLVLVAALVTLVRRKHTTGLGVISAGAVVAVLIIPFLHRTLPFPRVWVFAAPFFLWALVEAVFVIRPFLEKFPKRRAAILLTLILVAAGAWQYRSMQNIIAIEKGSIFHKKLADEMVEKGYRKVFIQEFYSYAYLPYHFKNSTLHDEVKLTIDGSTEVVAKDWLQHCDEQEVMVLETSFRSDSLLAGCLVDTSDVNVLLTAQGCACIREKLNRY